MTLFLQRLFDGLANGSLYGSLALAIVVVYRASGRINFAQGELASLGTYVSLVLTSPVSAFLAGTALVAAWLPGTPWPLWLAIPAAMLVTAVVASAAEALVIRRIPQRSAQSAVAVTIGLLLLVNALVTQLWTSTPRGYPSPFPNDPDDYLSVFDARLRVTTVGTWVTLLAALGVLWLVLRASKAGLAFRAVASDRTKATLVGVRVGRVLNGGWAVAAALGTLVGCLAAGWVVLTPDLMVRLLVFSFAAATIGGLSSPGGALLGGIVVGVGQSLASGYVPYVDQVVALPLIVAAMIVMLQLRPTGLFGRKAEELGAEDSATAAPSAAVQPRVTLRRGSLTHRLALVAAGVAGVAAAVVPVLVLPLVEARLWTEVVATTIVLLGLALLSGPAAQLSLGHAVFVGVGAYTMGVAASRYGLPPLASVPFAAVIGFVVGALIGRPAVRIRGQYLAMVTFAVAVAFPGVIERFSWFTGGAFGPPASAVPVGPSWLPLPAERPFVFLHLVTVAVAAMAWWVLTNLRASAPGRAIVATAENDTAALTMGVPVTRTRTIVFGLAAMFAAVGGALTAIQIQSVTISRYTLFPSLAMFALVALFGPTSRLGAALAALTLVGTPWLLTSTGWVVGAQGVPPGEPGGGAYLLWGIALLVGTALAPAGIVPTLGRLLGRLVGVSDQLPTAPGTDADAQTGRIATWQRALTSRR